MNPRLRHHRNPLKRQRRIPENHRLAFVNREVRKEPSFLYPMIQQSALAEARSAYRPKLPSSLSAASSARKVPCQTRRTVKSAPFFRTPSICPQ
jgi:hypothetical protein